MKHSKEPSRKKSIVLLSILGVLLVAWSFLTFVPFEYGVKDYISVAGALTVGKDFGDSQYAVVKVKTKPEEGKEQEFLNKLTIQSAKILNQRMNLKGFYDAQVITGSSEGEYYIRVNSSSPDYASNALLELASQGEITFRYHSSYRDGEIIIDSTYIELAVAVNNNGTPAIAILLNEEGKDKIAAATTEIAGLTDENQKFMPIYIGDVEKYNPSVTAALTDGQLTMNVPTYNEAENIAILARTGGLEVDLESFTVLSSTPGYGFKAATVLSFAALAAIIVVLAIFIIGYGGTGIASALTLVVFVLLYLLALIIVPGAQLNIFTISAMFASLAALILSLIGIKDKILEEYRLGKKTSQAITSGHKRSFLQILDIHAPLFIAGLLMLLIPIGKFASFGAVLATGMFISAICAYLLSGVWLKLIKGLSRSETFFKLTKEDEQPAKLTPKKFEPARFGKKPFITPAAIIAAALIVGLVLQFTVGSAFNGGFDFNKRFTEAKITVGDDSINPEKEGGSAKFNSVSDAVKDIISDYAKANGTRVTFSAMQYAGVGTDATIVFSYKYGLGVSDIDAEAHNAALSQLITDSLPTIMADNGIEEDSQTNLNALLIVSQAQDFITGWLILAIGMILVAVLLYFLLRFKLCLALTSLAVLAHDVLVLVALAVLLRLPLGMEHVSGLLFAIIVSYSFMFIVFERIRANINRLSLKDRPVEYIVDKSIKEAFGPILFLTLLLLAALLAVAVGFIWLPVLASYAVPLMFAVVLSLYSSMVFAPLVFTELKKRIKFVKKPQKEEVDAASDKKPLKASKAK